eukprot:TRINITY_DN9276_c0_g1_i4.p1 TRINITY_DN9276_c0_g1~~TRINITY_DN9276_c0_g1_i4.p1  ORF type:complete len:380 (+),score=53.42 TRINITY_DN9276_c0_g1_i4:170-1309(+)
MFFLRLEYRHIKQMIKSTTRRRTQQQKSCGKTELNGQRKSRTTKKRKSTWIGKKKTSQKKQPPNKLTSFDAKGLRIFVKYPILKNLILKCSWEEKSPSFRESTNNKEKSLAGNRSQLSHSLTKDFNILEDWMREAEDKSRLDEIEQPPVFPLKGVYEKFLPSGGVSFTEKGKVAKEGNVPPREQFGNLSRADISILQSEVASLLNQSLGSESLNNVPQSSFHFRAKSDLAVMSQLVDESKYSVDLHSHMTSILPAGSTFTPSAFKRNIKKLDPLNRTLDEAHTSISKLLSNNEEHHGVKSEIMHKGSKVTLKQLQNSIAVSYTHLTLPTILLVQISVVAVSLKKKIEKRACIGKDVIFTTEIEKIQGKDSQHNNQAEDE